jgi:DNA-binding transcriptional ArsR family regulator
MRDPSLATGQANAGTRSSGRTGPRHRDADVLYLLQAELCRAIGHPHRIHILDLLSKNERTATQLRTSLGIGKVNLSQHLSLLKQAGLIRSRQRGREALYCLAIPEITDACQLVRNVLAVRLQQGTKLAKSLEASKPKITQEARVPRHRNL